MRHIIPISGKDSLATAIFQTVHEPMEYEYFYNDTGAELPETEEWLKKVEKAKGWEIKRIGSNLQEIIAGFNFLPSNDRRYCTRESKIEPMENWIGDDPAIVYYGLRADENRVGYKAKRNITPAYPLKDFGIDLRAVWAIVEAAGLMPPAFFWPAMHEAVKQKLDNPDISFLKPWEFQMLFAGRSRPNCFFCFYQRVYEWLWLADVHPALFDIACKMERDHGADGYTWQKGKTLTELIKKRGLIIDKRAKQIMEIIMKLRNGELFVIEETLLATTSCGLLCGK